MPPRPNRRMTLAAVDNRPPGGLPGSDIKPRGSRMSMIPRVGRENPIPQTPASSLNSNRRKTLGGHQTVATYDVQRSQVNRRQSIGKPLPRNTASENPRQSIGHHSAIAATSNRRKSVGAILKGSVENRRQSFGVPATNIVAKQDTRLVNDKAFQRECIQKIFNYLVNNGYNHPISQKAISRPSGRDFSLIVTFMLRKEDPCFQTGNMKFEDEVAMQFKALGYPFPVSKTALVAAGSPHTWPALLAALSWLVDFCNSLKVDSVHDDDDEDAIEYLEALQQRTDQNFLKYLGAAYVAFLRSDVQASDQLETELTAHFEKGNYLVEREFEQLTDINASICEEVEIIKNQENDIPIYDAKRGKYAADLEQLHDLIAQMDERKIAYEAKIAARKSELDETNRKLKILNAHMDQLNETVKSQKLSVADAEKIEEDRKGVEEAIERKLKLKSQLGENFSLIDKEQRDLNEKIRSASKTFNALVSELSKLSIIKEKKVDMKMSVVTSPTSDGNPSNILGVDPKSIVQPNLLKCKKAYTELITSTEMQNKAALDEMDLIEEALARETSNLQCLQMKLAELDETTALEQEAHTATLASHSTELEVIESKVVVLEDPSAIDDKYAHIERRFAQLKVLIQQHQDESTLRRQAFQEEINQVFQAISEYEEHYHQKVAELKKYAGQKAANKPVLVMPNNV